MSQINIRLMMDAKIKGTVVCLWKDIQMPALPPVGCSISLVGVETDCLDVTRILWLEELQLFVVSIEDYELDEVLSGWETDPEEETWFSTPFSVKVMQEVSIEFLKQVLGDMESMWQQIDAEWGPTPGGLAQSIADGNEPLIEQLRRMVLEGSSR